jgi:hypothetical protein
MATRLGRPKQLRPKFFSCRLTEQEYDDLRRCAILTGLSATDFLRDCIKKCKRNAKAKGTWPETIDRPEA